METARSVGAGRSAEVEFRVATEEDIPGEHRVFVAAERELLTRHNFPWASPPLDGFAPGQRHMIRNDAGRCHVAVAEGEVVGFGNTWVRGGTWFLAALFIDPGWQGLGVGRRLMELACAGVPSRGMTITDSIQPISNALYSKLGLLPATPILGFEGETRVEVVAGLATGPVTREALRSLDLAAYGFDRAIDHEFWATRGEGTVWYRGGEPVAYSYRRSNGQVGPLGGADPESAALALRAELARGGPASLGIPGTSRSLVRTALAAGLRLQAPAGLLLTTDGTIPPTSLAISSYGLL
jgi:GNAT superfamily N-acetyltransferase